MSTKLKRATITIDNIANELFPSEFPLRGARVRGYLDILEELQIHLQDKGDDPRYARVVFAVEGKDEFVDIREKDFYLAGVFPRVSSTRYAYGRDNKVLRRILSGNVGDTSVVSNNESMAKKWETELVSLGYPIKKI